ncbi:MAG: Lsr2 family protein [Bifidobacteriaceae bacterium]|jgi:hypothetical protein|nr:Lsr2 family protein [Bifidobacteriaceae bacterium]
MAQRVQVLLVDDLDGGTAEETVTFALDGVNYEIDLSGHNAHQLREALKRWTDTARRVSNRRTTGRTRRPANPNDDTAKVRAWALAAGHTVSDRGRIPQPIRDAYNAAHAN